jgi:hypothetical protein
MSDKLLAIREGTPAFRRPSHFMMRFSWQVCRRKGESIGIEKEKVHDQEHLILGAKNRKPDLGNEKRDIERKQRCGYAI